MHSDVRLYALKAMDHFLIRSPRAEIASRKTAGAKTAHSRVAIDGDSRVDQCSDGNRTNTIGWLYWLQLLTGARFEFRTSDNFGVGGQTTAKIMTRAFATAASAADIVIALMSTNDRTRGWTAATSIANMQLYQTAILASGKRLIWIAEIPRGDDHNAKFTLTGVQLDYHLRVREWLLAQQGVRGVAVADPWADMVDPTSASALAKAGVLKDGIHESPAGALAMAKSVAEIITRWLPPAPRLRLAEADAYSADNPTGSLVSNPRMLGASGSISGAGGSGVVADGWTATVPPGVTVALSKQAIGREEWQRAEISGTPSGVDAALAFSTLLPQARLFPGDVLEGAAEIHVDAGHLGLRGVPVRLQITDDRGGALAIAGDVHVTRGDIDLDAPAGAWGGIAPVPPVTIGAGAISKATFTIVVVGLSGAPISAIVRWRAATVHKSV